MDPKRVNQALSKSISAASAACAGAPLEQALRLMTEEVSRVLGVERASAWLYNADASAIRCVDLYVRTTAGHESGVELGKKDYPKYFDAIRTERTIAANDAHTDAATAEFSAGYLKPLGIGAMLDTPIRAGDTMIGVVCSEHIGDARAWTDDECQFAATMADLIAIAIHSSRKRETEEQLRATLAALEEG